jgi:hypothetical protein
MYVAINVALEDSKYNEVCGHRNVHCILGIFPWTGFILVPKIYT